MLSWSLLSDHPKNSRLFSSIELQLAKRFIASNFGEQSPSTRQKIFTGLKKVFFLQKSIILLICFFAIDFRKNL